MHAAKEERKTKYTGGHLDDEVGAHRVAAVPVEPRDLLRRDAVPQRKREHLRFVVFVGPVTPAPKELFELVEARLDRVVARAVRCEEAEPCPPATRPSP